VNHTNLDITNVWRHVQCPMLIYGNNQNCNRCKKLFALFRVYRKRLGSGQKKYIGPTLTPTRASRLQQMVKSKHSLQKSNLRLIFINVIIFYLISMFNILILFVGNKILLIM